MPKPLSHNIYVFPYLPALFTLTDKNYLLKNLRLLDDIIPPPQLFTTQNNPPKPLTHQKIPIQKKTGQTPPSRFRFFNSPPKSRQQRQFCKADRFTLALLRL
jgi:hypothetical protein